MKAYAIVATEKGHAEVQEVQVGDPGPKEIQVRVHTSVISPGTERAWILNLPNTPGRFPHRTGYCTAGVVEKVGSEVTEFSVGDRVGCHMLSHCSLGNVEEEWVVKIPDGVPFEKAAFVTMGQITLQGVRKARIELGEKVMVIGMGVIGQLALQQARLNGALPAIGVDRVESRLKAALACGADMVINTNDEKWMEAAGEKPQVVFDATGAPDAVELAFKASRNFGRVVLLASTRGISTVNFYADIHSKGITVLGAHAGRVPQNESSPGLWPWKDDANCFMQFLAAGKLNLEPLITDRISWKQADDAYKKLLDWNMDMIGTVINWI
jgi:2-desacetyl-2-hydroxyethyl bacteriochlorophyllide A dehydrogenase